MILWLAASVKTKLVFFEPVLVVVVVGLPDLFLEMRVQINSAECQQSGNFLRSRLEFQNIEVVAEKWPCVESQEQGSLARDEKCLVIKNHNCCTNKSRLDQSCIGIRQKECSAHFSVNERGHNQWSKNTKVLRGYGRDLMLKKNRLDTASLTGAMG